MIDEDGREIELIEKDRGTELFDNTPIRPSRLIKTVDVVSVNDLFLLLEIAGVDMKKVESEGLNLVITHDKIISEIKKIRYRNKFPVYKAVLLDV